jgi:hypothetical protein
MPEDQKFHAGFHRGDNGTQADFPALITAEAVCVMIRQPVRTHLKDFHIILLPSIRKAFLSVNGPRLYEPAMPYQPSAAVPSK